MNKMIAGAAILLVTAAGAVGYLGSRPTSGATSGSVPMAAQATSSMNMSGMNTTNPDTQAPNGNTTMQASQAPVGNTTNMALTPQQIQQQNQEADNLLHEKALVPKILTDGTKQFTLTASMFPWYLWLGQTVEAWGYNKQVAGPLIRVRVGDKVEIVVHNQLPEGTTVHWHGLAVPNAMDGVPNVTQPPIQPGGTFVYRFTVTPQMVGTHYYHSHMDDLFQVDHGLYGPLIVDPKTPTEHYDVDALYILGSWNLSGQEGNEDTFAMDGKPYPNAPQLNVKRGQTVRIRLINASGVSEHAMHLHGYTFKVIAIDGNPVKYPQEQNTVTLLPGETADIAFTANNPGRWMFHCHILDHTMNPGDEVDDMGGLMTFINVK